LLVFRKEEIQLRRQTKLQGLRKEKGKTQKDLADILEMSRRSYMLRENGDLDFKLGEMKKLSEYFNIPVSQIFLM